MYGRRPLASGLLYTILSFVAVLKLNRSKVLIFREQDVNVLGQDGIVFCFFFLTLLLMQNGATRKLNLACNVIRPPLMLNTGYDKLLP